MGIAGLTGVLAPVAVPAAATGWPQPAPGFRKALLADGPDPACERELMTYGQFVGSWRLVSTDHQAGKVITGEAHFGWVLRGRAVQDVWIAHDRQDPGFGSTLRVYRPDEGIWRISFLETLGGVAAELESRVVGAEIVETSVWSADHYPAQWIYSDITPDSFNWRVQSLNGEVFLSTVATRTR